MSITVDEIAAATGLSRGRGRPDLWGEVGGMMVHIEWSRYTSSAYIDIYAKKGDAPVSEPMEVWRRSHEGFSLPRPLPGKGTGMRLMLKLGPEDTAGVFAAELLSLVKMLSDNGCVPVCSGCSREGREYSFYRVYGNVEYICPECAGKLVAKEARKPSPAEQMWNWLKTLVSFLPGTAVIFAGELWLLKQGAGLGMATILAAAGILLNIYLYRKTKVRPSWLTMAVCVVVCCAGAAAGLVFRYAGYMAEYNRSHAEWYHQALDYSRAVQLGMDPEEAKAYIEPEWQEEITGLLDGMAPDKRKAWCYHISVAEKCRTAGECVRRFRVLIGSGRDVGIERSYMERLRIDYMAENSAMGKAVTLLCALSWNAAIKSDRKRRVVRLSGGILPS